jgi:hypothetical protein
MVPAGLLIIGGLYAYKTAPDIAIPAILAGLAIFAFLLSVI